MMFEKESDIDNEEQRSFIYKQRSYVEYGKIILRLCIYLEYVRYKMRKDTYNNYDNLLDNKCVVKYNNFILVNMKTEEISDV